MPDLISSLGKQENLSYEHFQYIIKYIMSFIMKDKQHLELVKKLCDRFTMNEQNEKEWEYTAYCLSLLSYNQNSLEKLIESAKTFGNKLHLDGVKQPFLNLCTRLRKFAKPEMKTKIEELEKIILHEGGENEMEEEKKEEQAEDDKMSEDEK